MKSALLKIINYIYLKIFTFFPEELEQKLYSSEKNEEIKDSLENINELELEVKKVKKEKFNYALIKNFIEEFIGVPIIGVDIYTDSDHNFIECVGKIIVKVEINNKKANLFLSNLEGGDFGRMIMPFSLTGQILEKTIDDLPASNSLYKINFYGGDSIEYTDDNQENILIFEQ